MTDPQQEPAMNQIYKDHNGLIVSAVTQNVSLRAEPGCHYSINFGPKAYGQHPPVPYILRLDFQEGPVPEKGVNGLTTETLLAALIHRTEALDAKFGCEENKRAIADMKNALVNLEVRTARRMMRGVEGKLEA